MSVKLPPIEQTIAFLEKAEELADGKRQTSYLGEIIGEFATYVNTADEEVKYRAKLEAFLKKERLNASLRASDFLSEHDEGAFDAFDKVLRFLGNTLTEEELK